MTDLHEVRAAAARLVSLIDQLLAGQPPAEDEGDLARFRTRPGGPLTEEGIAEMEGRFEGSESDSTIALAMRVSLDGVARRRAMWRKQKQLEADVADLKGFVEERRSAPAFVKGQPVSAEGMNRATGVGQAKRS